MTKQFVLRFAALMLFGLVLPLRGQSESKPGARLDLGDVRAVSRNTDDGGRLDALYVTLRLRTSDQQLVVAYRGESDGGRKVLSGFFVPDRGEPGSGGKTRHPVGAHLEVQTTSGWQRPRARTTRGVLGYLSIDKADAALIAPRSEPSFDFLFSRRFFDVEPGQKLRVVVDAWPDAESMKVGGPCIQLTSPPFACPETGFGQ